ncbi:MAG: enoyl-CoA hydratase/isomerase family protein [Mycobacteriales bacterium]
MSAGPADAGPLLVGFDGGVLRLTLNRPEARNAINGELRRLLREALTVDAAAPEVRVVVLQGDSRAFCSGGDINEMGGPSTVSGKLDEGRAIVEAISRLAKPVVAAVRGHASGAGFSLAMACDLVVADETAVFRSVFVKRGLIPDLGGTYWLARQVGLFRAKEIIFTGRAVGAQEAHDLGLVARLWSSTTFEGELAALSAELANGPTIAYGVAKQLLNRTFETDLSTALELERLGQALASGSEDHRTSIEAFKTKTDAVFHGR